METRACFLFPFLAVRPVVTRARGRAFALVVVFLLYISLSPPLVVSTLAREGLFTSQAPTSVDASPSPSPTAAPSSSPSAAPASDRELILVKFKGGATSAAIDAAIASLGGDSVRDLPQIRTRVIAVPASERASTHAAKYAKHASVERAAPAVQLEAAGAPNDPGYAQQWALPKIAWDAAYSTVPIVSTAAIAVLDTGIDSSHPDLLGRVLVGRSFVGGVPTVDPNGHGTAVAGIAAAKVNNLIGMAGVAYNDAPLLPVQVLHSDGTGYDSDVVAGVLWAADNGANVILMGFSSRDFSAALQDAVNYAWSKGTVLVAATGNNATSAATYPAGMANVIGVAATDRNDVVTATSNTGSAAVAAPGVDIYATRPGATYANLTGTSASAAETAGLAALLIASGKSNSAASAQIRGATDPVAGRSFGRINVLKALTTVAPPQPTPAPTPTPTPGPTPTYIPAPNPSLKLDQCANGPPSTPDPCTADTAWVTGNLGTGNSHYFEGDSVPYRISFANLSTTGTHTVTFQWDTTKSGKHAIDYVTTFNRTVTTADPCAGVTGCGSPTVFPIPPDPNFAAACPTCTQVSGNFTIYNGVITAVSAYTLTGTYSGDSSTSITVTFAATTTTPVLAWGGHIASQQDWGAGNSAVNITGSPYHMRVLAFSDGNVGNEDRSLSANAVAVKRNVVVTKNTFGGNGTFSFTLTGPGGVTMSATISTTGTTLTGSGTATFSGLAPGTYTVTEAANADFVPVGLTTCTAVVTGAGSTPCSPSFLNNARGSVVVTKNTTGGNGTFTFTLTGPGVTMSATISTTGTTLTGSGTATFSGLAPGTYTVTEAANADFVPVGSTTCTAVVTGAGSTP